MSFSRREFIERSAAFALAFNLPRGMGTPAPPQQTFELQEWTIAQLQAAMRSGELTSHKITELYLSRIAALDQAGPQLRHVIELNPDALAIAAQRDAERKAGRARGPLDGIPVIVKDNIDTADKMHTSAGSLALARSIARRDSGVAERLRAAGAVIIAKSNLSEWANIRSPRSSSGWSARGGQGRNPYVLDRTPCGSSSGTAGGLAASYAAVGIGTETDGSILCPASMNSLVGIKPTLGLISRAGIIPVAHSQDTAGPMARTVTDAAILLSALTGQDGRDPATALLTGRPRVDYTTFLDPAGLKGARIGIAREQVMGFSVRTDQAFEVAVEVLTRSGAILVDPADIPNYGEYDQSELTVLLTELKADLNAYLGALGPDAEVHSLEQLIAFNEANREREMPYFGQEFFLLAQEQGPLTDPRYLSALANNQRLSRTEGIDVVMDRERLDVIVVPTAGPAWTIDLLGGDHGGGSTTTPAAVSGYPSITVPMGFVSELPVGLSFIGRPWSEGLLIKLAFAFEQTTKHRRAPQFLPTAPLRGFTGL